MRKDLKLNITQLLNEEEILKKMFEILRENKIDVISDGEHIIITIDNRIVGSFQEKKIEWEWLNDRTSKRYY